MSTPSISATVEPGDNGVAHYLKCAPSTSGGNETGHINLHLMVSNTGATKLHVNKIEISVVGSATAAMPFSISMDLSVGDTVGWTQPADYVVAVPANPSLKLKISADGFTEPAEITQSLAPHTSPTADGSYRFWAEVRDLRPGEFWQMHGTSHAQSNYAQLFAYDVGVAVESGSSYSKVFPNTDGKKNEHHRIWGKPIYAVADGTVTDFRNDFPTNPKANENPPQNILDLITNVGDGSGNFFTITTGDENVVYCHMQPGSLNAQFLSAGAAVKKGDFLGLAGNSGASSGPHLHIHANKSNGSQSWVNEPRPMPFRNARAVAWSSVDATASNDPWVQLNGRGVPTDDCAVWPSDAAVVDLKEVTVRHFAITEEGRVWIVKSDTKVRTTSNRLPGFGIFFDADPGGLAKEVVVRGQKPYVIGMDDKIWEGLPDHWAVLPGSPTCKRLAIDLSNGKVWVVALDTRVLSFNPTTRAWTEHPGGGKAKDICARNGVVHVIGMDDKIWKSVGANGWTPLAGQGKGKRIAVDDQSGKLWVVGMNDGMWSHAGNGNWVEHPGGGRAKDIALYQSLPYVIGLDNGIWKSIGQFGWQRLNLVEPV